VLSNLGQSFERAYFNDMSLLLDDEKQALCTPEFLAQARHHDPIAAFARNFERVRDADPLSRVLYVDFKTWLANDILVKVDRMSMACSLEVRAPLLDHKIIEFAASLPPRLKFRGSVSKFLLKRHVASRVPAADVHRRKQGFELPLATWLRGDLRETAHDLLFSTRASGRGYVRPEAVKQIWDAHQSGSRKSVLATLGADGTRAVAPTVHGHAMTGFERQWQSRFEKFATRHRSDHLVSGWSAGGLRRRVAVFEGLLDGGLIDAGARALELGCGAGTYVRLLTKRGHPVIGLDYSLPSLERAAAADPSPMGRYIAGNASCLPFRTGSFRAVTCIGVFQALVGPEAAVRKSPACSSPPGGGCRNPQPMESPGRVPASLGLSPPSANPAALRLAAGSGADNGRPGASGPSAG